MGLISLAEYAKRHGKNPAVVRQKAARGGFSTARKIGRDWIIEENEPYIDHRIKSGKHIGARNRRSRRLGIFFCHSTPLSKNKKRRRQHLAAAFFSLPV